jgi:GNAT superfamily N-acetyltransferase
LILPLFISVLHNFFHSHRGTIYIRPDKYMPPVSLFLIRQANASDIPALHSLIELSVRGLQKDDYSPAQIEGALGHALGLDTQLIEDGTYFVAEPVEQAGVIVGCGGWSNRKTLFGSDHGPNRENIFLDPKTDAAKIRAIFVHPKWARQGLGTLILEHCEEAAQRAGFRTLEMGSTLTGVPLYTLKGYIPRENVAVPLPNGETLPIVHMVKAL